MLALFFVRSEIKSRISTGPPHHRRRPPRPNSPVDDDEWSAGSQYPLDWIADAVRWWIQIIHYRVGNPLRRPICRRRCPEPLDRDPLTISPCCCCFRFFESKRTHVIKLNASEFHRCEQQASGHVM